MSAESERVFSGTRRQITPDRARLTGSAITKAECLKSWIKHGIKLIEEDAGDKLPSEDSNSDDEHVTPFSNDGFNL